MDRLLEEERITLTKLAKELDVHTGTVRRWAQRGIKGIRLETFCIGGRRYTTRGAQRRFVVATSDAGAPSKPPRIPCPERQRRIDAAKRRLDEMGV